MRKKKLKCEVYASIILVLNMQINNDFSLLETILFHPTQGFYLLKRHLNRLFVAIDDFKEINPELFPHPPTKEKVNDYLHRNVPCNGYYRRVRLLVDASDSNITVENTVLSKPEFDYRSLEEAALSDPRFNVILDTQPISTKNDPFILHKTTQRTVYDLARERTHCDYHATEDKAFDVILWNEQHEITESSIANIAIRFPLNDKRTIWKTPKIECGLLPGVARSFLLEETKEMVEDVITVDELIQAAKNDYPIVCFNSVRKAYRVNLLLK
ncbi:MAG: aminotransferase [Benjaminiella poitrasii]|nr:MAG: aminotransferase [Benjaminiella poitrasii]